MLAGIIDHLWQSIAFVGLIWLLVLLTRRNAAALQPWLWVVAGLKFVVPFAILFAFGAWLGFPVRHSAVPPPAAVAEMVQAGMAVAAPAQMRAPGTSWAAIALLPLLGISALCLVWICRRWRAAKLAHELQQAREATHGDERAVPLGFFQSATLAAVALFTVALPVIAGATRDRQWRQQVLAIDERGLQSAGISMQESPRGAGLLTRVSADARGVLIQNINIQDLVSMVYGIGKFEVFGGALPWLEYPRYDVRITGPVRAPEVFDPYSLRQPMTNYLHDRFGVSIRVNGSCQAPCKDYESFVIERLPRCTHLLGAHPECGAVSAGDRENPAGGE